MKFVYLFLLLFLPFMASTQQTERWVLLNKSENLFISTHLDSTYVFPKEKPANRVKEYKVVSDQKLFRLRENQSAEQIHWLKGEDTLALVTFIKGNKHILLTFNNGEEYDLKRLSRKEWVIRQGEKSILKIEKHRESGSSFYYLTPEHTDGNLSFLKPFAFAYLVSCREGRDIRTFGISVLALGAIVSSAATNKEELLQMISSNF